MLHAVPALPRSDRRKSSPQEFAPAKLPTQTARSRGRADAHGLYPPNRVTPNTRARMMTNVSAVNTARLNQLNQITGCDG